LVGKVTSGLTVVSSNYRAELLIIGFALFSSIGRRPVMFLGVALLVLGRCVLAFSASLYPVFLTAVVVTSLPMGVIFQSPLIIGIKDETRASGYTVEGTVSR
jgi:predicted MFS family arabinose efflux permease